MITLAQAELNVRIAFGRAMLVTGTEIRLSMPLIGLPELVRAQAYEILNLAFGKEILNLAFGKLSLASEVEHNLETIQEVVFYLENSRDDTNT